MHRGEKAGRARGADEEEVNVVGNGHFVHRKPARGPRLDDIEEIRRRHIRPDVERPELGHLAGEKLGVAAGRQGYDLEAVRQLADDVERLPADGAGGAEDGDAGWASHSYHPIALPFSVTAGAGLPSHRYRFVCSPYTTSGAGAPSVLKAATTALTSLRLKAALFVAAHCWAVVTPVNVFWKWGATQRAKSS